MAELLIYICNEILSSSCCKGPLSWCKCVLRHGVASLLSSPWGLSGFFTWRVSTIAGLVEVPYRKENSVEEKWSWQSYLAFNTESTLQKFHGSDSVWLFLITAAGRGPRPTVNVDVIKVLLANTSEYFFLMIREESNVQKIQIAMTRSLFCWEINQIFGICLWIIEL